MADKIQAVILTLRDGRKLRYYGSEQVKPSEGLAVVDIVITIGHELPPGYSLDVMHLDLDK